MLAAALLLAAVQEAPPMLAEIRDLPPAQAGERVLAGENHRPIVSTLQPCCMMAPWYNYHLMEAPVAIAGGCVQVVWQARFVSPRGGDPPTAALQKVLKFTGVARAIDGTCPAHGYTYSTLPPARVVELLAAWKIVLSSRKTKFECADASPTQLCGGAGHIREDLGEKWVGGLEEEGGLVKLTLNMPLVNAPAQIYTDIVFDPDGKLPVRVIRKVPPPF
jgi:hypothetical protein